MKWIVRFFMSFIILAVLAIGGVGAFLYSFNPNDYKPMIAEQFKAATGRDLTLGGDIRATFFPVLGFRANKVAIGNPPEFKEKEFLSLETVQVGIKVLPLIDHKVEFTQITLNTPTIHVIRQKNGAMNTNFSAPAKAPQDIAPQAGPGVSALPFSIQVESIKIQNAKLIYDDLAMGMAATLAPLNVTVPGFTPGAPITFDLDTGAKIILPTMSVDGTFAIKGTMDIGKQILTLASLQTDSKISGAAFNGGLAAKVSAKGDVNLKDQKLDLVFNQADIDWNGTSVRATGAAKGPTIKPAITFQAKSDDINLDKMFAKNPASATTTPATPTAPSPVSGNTVVIPVDVIRPLDLDGSVDIGTLTTGGLVLTDVSAKILAKGGDLRIAPINAKFYDGVIATDLGVNARASTPVVTFKSTLKGIQAGKVITAKMGDDYVSGIGKADIDLTMTGATSTALKNSTSGTVSFAFENGKINKWHLTTLISQAIAFIKTKQLPTASETELYFSSFTGTFTGTNGVFQNNDLTLAGPKLHAFGDGTINLPTNTVDYTMQVGDGAPDRTAKHVPVRITGPLNAPKYNLDIQAVVQDKVQEQIDKARDKFTDKLIKKLGGDAAPAPTAEPAIDPVTGEAVPAPAPAPATPKDVGRELLKGLLR